MIKTILFHLCLCCPLCAYSCVSTNSFGLINENLALSSPAGKSDIINPNTPSLLPSKSEIKEPADSQSDDNKTLKNPNKEASKSICMPGNKICIPKNSDQTNKSP